MRLAVASALAAAAAAAPQDLGTIIALVNRAVEQREAETVAAKKLVDGKMARCDDVTKEMHGQKKELAGQREKLQSATDALAAALVEAQAKQKVLEDDRSSLRTEIERVVDELNAKRTEQQKAANQGAKALFLLDEATRADARSDAEADEAVKALGALTGASSAASAVPSTSFVQLLRGGAARDSAIAKERARIEGDMAAAHDAIGDDIARLVRLKGELEKDLETANAKLQAASADVIAQELQISLSRARLDAGTKRDLRLDKLRLMLGKECKLQSGNYEAQESLRTSQVSLLRMARALYEGQKGSSFVQIGARFAAMTEDQVAASLAQAEKSVGLAAEENPETAKTGAAPVAAPEATPVAAETAPAPRVLLEVSASTTGRADPLANVRDMISSMIGQLEKKANEAVGLAKFCDEEKLKQTMDGNDLKLQEKKLAAEEKVLDKQVVALRKDEVFFNAQASRVEKMVARLQADQSKLKSDTDERLEGMRSSISAVQQAASEADRVFGGEASAAVLQAGSQPTEARAMLGKALAALREQESLIDRQVTEMAALRSSMESAATATRSAVVKERTESKLELAKCKARVATIVSERDRIGDSQKDVQVFLGGLNRKCAGGDPREERMARREETIRSLQEALRVLAEEENV